MINILPHSFKIFVYLACEQYANNIIFAYTRK